jgi:putative transposase
VLVREICAANCIKILSGYVSREHVHLLALAPPNSSSSKIIPLLKGKISRKLLSEFQPLLRACWDRHLWAREYFVAGAVNVADEVIAEYIQLQQSGGPGDGGATLVLIQSPHL